MFLYWLHKKAKELVAKFASVKDAWDYFDAQKNSIKELRTLEWYTHIRQFFENEAEEALTALRDWKTPLSDTPNFKAQANTAIKFLDRLDNMTKS